MDSTLQLLRAVCAATARLLYQLAAINKTPTAATIKRATCNYGAITSKIKHAIKHKTSPARLAPLLQPSLAFCFSLKIHENYTGQFRANSGQKIQGTGRYAVIGCKLKQNANEGCNSCATVVQVLQDLFYVSLHVLFYL